MNEILTLIIESFPKIIVPGLLLTLPLTIISFSLALGIAIIVASVQYAKVPVLSKIMRFYIWIMRGTPLLIQLYIVYFGLPSVGILINPIPAAILVFSLNEGAYTAETIRGAMEAIPAGQMEAGYAVGMTYPEILVHIILPQAFRSSFPALSNSVISMVKDMSLAANISVAEMFYATKRIVAYKYEALVLYLELAVVYLLFCTALTLLQRFIEKKLKWKHKKAKEVL